MFKLIVGEEAFLKYKLISDCRKDSDVLLTTSEIDVVIEEIYSVSFLVNKKTLIYTGSLKDLDQPDIWDFLDKEDADTALLAIPHDNSYKNTSFYKKLSSEYSCSINCCNKLSQEELVTHITAVVTFEDDKALSEYLTRASYHHEGGKNLFEINSELSILKLLERDVRYEDVVSLFDPSEAANIFLLLDLIKSKNFTALIRECDKIINSEASEIGALMALMRNYRISFKNSLGATSQEVGSWSPSVSKGREGVILINSYYEAIKKGLLSPDAALKLCVLELCNI